MKKPLNPISITDTHWMYIKGRSILFVYQIFVNGEYIRTDSIKIPLRKIEKFLNGKPKGKKKK